jgi:hypothetical protein
LIERLTRTASGTLVASVASVQDAGRYCYRVRESQSRYFFRSRKRNRSARRMGDDRCSSTLLSPRPPEQAKPAIVDVYLDGLLARLMQRFDDSATHRRCVWAVRLNFAWVWSHLVGFGVEPEFGAVRVCGLKGRL